MSLRHAPSCPADLTCPHTVKASSLGSLDSRSTKKLGPSRRRFSTRRLRKVANTASAVYVAGWSCPSGSQTSARSAARASLVATRRLQQGSSCCLHVRGCSRHSITSIVSKTIDASPAWLTSVVHLLAVPTVPKQEVWTTSGSLEAISVPLAKAYHYLGVTSDMADQVLDDVYGQQSAQWPNSIPVCKFGRASNTWCMALTPSFPQSWTRFKSSTSIAAPILYNFSSPASAAKATSPRRTSRTLTENFAYRVTVTPRGTGLKTK